MPLLACPAVLRGGRRCHPAAWVALAETLRPLSPAPADAQQAEDREGEGRGFGDGTSLKIVSFGSVWRNDPNRVHALERSAAK